MGVGTWGRFKSIDLAASSQANDGSMQQILSEELRVEPIPMPDADWGEIISFAWLYLGYREAVRSENRRRPSFYL